MPVQKSTVTRAKKVAAPPPANPADLAARFADFPAIDLLSRQLNNPDDGGTLPILLKDEDPDACVNSDHILKLKPAATHCHICRRKARKWYVRTINTAIEGRWAKIRKMGYVPVDADELLSEDDVAGRVKHPGDNYVRLGDRGQEILVKRPLEIHTAIKRNFLDRVNMRASSSKQVTADLAEAAGSELGDEAGQTIYEGGIKVESYKKSKSTLEAEGAED